MLIIANTYHIYNAAYQNQGKQEGINQTKVGTAAPGDVLAGKTFTSGSGVGLTGNMANKGAWTNTPTNKGKVTIPAGYHNGSGYIDTTSVYNKGMSDADARVNTNSESYKKGYALGGASGKLEIELTGTLVLDKHHIYTGSPGGDFPGWMAVRQQPVTVQLEITVENGVITEQNIVSVETATQDYGFSEYGRCHLTALTISSIKWVKN